MYSGPVAGRGYALVAARNYDVVVLVGPSHYVAFDGVAIWPEGRFETPIGTLAVDADVASRLARAHPALGMTSLPHVREHSLELQLPFLARVMPEVPIVPVLMGRQTRSLVDTLAAALPAVLGRRRALLVASSDLSHYHDRATASRLDRVVLDHVERCDADGLQAALEQFPGHACGGGPIVAVMRAAQSMGATRAAVMHYADSGDISGDLDQVVGYMSAVIGGSE
jgi:AmmeMemoRadiSam system protein B